MIIRRVASPVGALSSVVPSSPVVNSLADRILGPLGKVVTVDKTLAQGTEPISVNLFSFTGPFRLMELYAIVTEATEAGDCDDAFFNLYDGTNVIDLSDDQSASGATLSNITVGSVIGLNNVATEDMFFQKSDQARYLAAANIGSALWQRGLVVAKNGVTNYVRFTYDSAADSALDIDITFVMVYAELNGLASGIAAVTA